MKRSILALVFLAACSDAAVDTASKAGDYVVTDLGGDFGWSEGPVWIQDGQYLLFTDVPGNTIHRYKDGEGISVWLRPSGSDPVADYTSSAGANGLFPYKSGQILVPDHGNRALYALDLETKRKTLLADQFEGKRLNSPNDVVVHKTGVLFFTDPPYGLKDQDDNPAKELDFNGVYALSPEGVLTVFDRDITRPNGIALSPDHRTLYVANSDANDARIFAYDVSAEGDVTNKRVFLDVVEERKALPWGNLDGMTVATDGTIYATGLEGVLVLSPAGERLGMIETGKAVANAAFGGADGSTLFLTSSDKLYSVKTDKVGLGF